MEKQQKTLILLPIPMYEELRRRSFDGKVSQSEIVRQALELFWEYKSFKEKFLEEKEEHEES